MTKKERQGIPYPGIASVVAGLAVLACAGGFALHMDATTAAALLLVAPFMSGFAAAFVRSEWAAAPLRDSLAAALVALAGACLVLCLGAHDGPLIVLMAAPPAIVLSLLGAIMGHSTVAHGRPSMGPVVALLMCWPLLAAAEIEHPPEPRTVSSIIDVDRSLAHLSQEALSAEIGAIEQWQLIAGFARREDAGEFHLQELPEGRTRIEARTVYTLEMYPERYWSWWSDAIIQRMQLRALAEIKRQAEDGPI